MTKIAITYPHAHKVSHSFMLSLMREVAQAPVEFTIDMLPERCFPGDDLAMGRNRAAARFLDETDADYLWTLDTDIGFQLGTMERLLEGCTERTPVVGALYHVIHEHGDDGMGGPAELQSVPAAYRWREVGIETYEEYPPGRMEVDVMGAGCLMMTRPVLAGIRQDFGDNWWSLVERNGSLMGEDVSFFWRLKARGITPILDTTIATTHHKEIWVRHGS